MKKIAFLMGAGVLALASCTSEGVVNPAEQQAGETPIGFVSHMPNMGRSGERGLENESLDFGVWAYKATAETGIKADGATVMDHYLVGYWNADKTVGYQPTAGQSLYGTKWYYEGLGYDTTDDHNFTFHGNDVQAAETTSEHDIQYLKYWDRTEGLYTYFYACVPYAAGVFNPANRTMRFPGMMMSDDPKDLKDEKNQTNNYMYAFAKYKNTDMVVNNATTGEAEAPVVDTKAQYVNLGFKHLGAQIRLGFYEEIPGYKVQLIGYSAANPQIYCVPAHVEGTTYTRGEYVKAGNPRITFVQDGTPSATVDYPGTLVMSDKDIVCPLWFYNPVLAKYDDIISNDGTKYSYGGWKGVMPQKNNDGFTLNVSFKLIAEDTQEEIYVRGARVFVPADKCNWLANTRYTYIFRVTTAVPGQSEDPGTPVPNPNDKQYLFPIVFDQVTVEGWEDVENVTPLL